MPKTFSDTAAGFAADVAEFVADAREQIEDFLRLHADAQTSADPQGDESGVWAAFTRASSPFDDVERALTALLAVTSAVAQEAQAAVNARAADPDVALDPSEPSTHEPAELPRGVKAAKKAAAKPAKKAAAKKG